MKKISTLLIGLFLLAPVAQAQVTTASPVSDHYVKVVLDRVDDGIAILPGKTTSYDLIFFDWLATLSTTMLELVDTELRIVEQQRDLYRMTPCLHLDLIILEQKIEELRKLMLSAFEEGRTFDIIRLQEMIRFLNTRYRHLVRGARDPHYTDPGLKPKYGFDEETWCCPLVAEGEDGACVKQTKVSCREASEGGKPGLTFETSESCGDYPGCSALDTGDLEELVCPFHSDYLPPTVAGYGCDLTALNALSGIDDNPNNNLNNPNASLLSIRAERDALQVFITKRDEFLDSINFISVVTQEIYEAMGREFTPEELQLLENFPAVLTREHKSVSNCSLTDNSLLEFEAPPPWPEGAAKWERRGPFSITSDEFNIVRGLYDMLQGWGRRRDQPDIYTLPTEYPPDSTERDEAEDRENRVWVAIKILRHFYRQHFRSWNIKQAGLETKSIVQAGDTQAQMTELTKSLRKTMKNFYELSSEQDKGIRRFTINFSYFLRRTCVYRPCNLLLDRVLKISFEDKCFPYTSGDYIKYASENILATPPHESCKGGAFVVEELGRSFFEEEE